jgi:hypothetical protein
MFKIIVQIDMYSEMWHIKLSHKSDYIDLIVVLFMPPDSNISSSFWSKKSTGFFHW